MWIVVMMDQSSAIRVLKTTFQYLVQAIIGFLSENHEKTSSGNLTQATEASRIYGIYLAHVAPASSG